MRFTETLRRLDFFMQFPVMMVYPARITVSGDAFDKFSPRFAQGSQTKVLAEECSIEPSAIPIASIITTTCFTLIMPKHNIFLWVYHLSVCSLLSMGVSDFNTHEHDQRIIPPEFHLRWHYVSAPKFGGVNIYQTLLASSRSASIAAHQTSALFSVAINEAYYSAKNTSLPWKAPATSRSLSSLIPTGGEVMLFNANVTMP